MGMLIVIFVNAEEQNAGGVSCFQLNFDNQANCVGSLLSFFFSSLSQLLMTSDFEGFLFQMLSTPFFVHS